MTTHTYQESVDEKAAKLDQLHKNFRKVLMTCCDNLNPAAPQWTSFDEGVFRKWRGLLLDSKVHTFRQRFASHLAEQFSIALRISMERGVISEGVDTEHVFPALLKVCEKTSDTSWTMVKKICESMDVSPNFQREYVTEWLNSEIREHDIQVQMVEGVMGVLPETETVQ